jgi:hypothetical protein
MGATIHEAYAQSLPLKRVMLSTGGVGYFEHEATVTGDAELSLEIRLDQVDDVLKSIVVYDATGRVGTIGLPGREPLAQAFRDLPFGQNALASPAALLGALKGAEVAVTGPRKISGRVLAINRETVTLPKTGATTAHHRVTLYTAQGMESFILEDTQAVRLADRNLQGQVNAALAAIARHRLADRRTLRIKVAGAGPRLVRVAYVVPTPLWKTSYRLTLARDVKAKAGHLQGWAVVENMTGRDWKGVELALVSGNPVTFRQAIYQAYYVRRPEVPVAVLGRILPRADKGVVGGAVSRSEAAPKSKLKRDGMLRDMRRAQNKQRSYRSRERAAGVAELSATRPPMASKDELVAQAPPARPAFRARGRESATQVVFRIPQPVDLAAGHSLIVPIADRKVPAARISLYQPRTHADHPVANARLTNNAKTGLPGGVLTLYERDAKTGAVAYLGDAQLRTLPPGESRLVGFALDEKVRMEREDKASTSLTKGKIARGIFHHVRMARRTTIYRLKGAQDAPRRVIVEHPRAAGWSLDAPDRKKVKVDLAEGVYRIAVDLKPGDKRRLEVVTSRPRRESLGLSSLRAHRVNAFAGTQTLSPRVRAAFKRMGELMVGIERHKGEVKKITQQQKGIFADQSRIRDNMRRVNNRSQLYQRYVKKLDLQENALEAMESKLESARAAQRKAEKVLADYVAALDL